MKYIVSKLWFFVLLIVGVVLPSSVWAEGGHQLTLTAKPSMAGSFNTNSVELMAGETIHLYAYANASFTFLRWTDDSGATVSQQKDFIYTMPTHDCKLTAEYEYNPANPANPARNYWKKELGEVIVDDFTAGGLVGAISTVISGSSRDDVAMITVAGRMNDNDFGIANNYTNCTLLDLSRVTGVTQVPSYAFDYTKLESVYLPATIEKIGYRAFYECKQLSSLITYAMTPPTLENQVFTNVPEGLVVYVPATSMAQYQDAEGWKDFTLLPIQEDIRSVSVSLPNGTNVADYVQMWLEMTNTKSGQRMHYVMTNRETYTFANIIRNTSWNVTLRNERGDIFGQIDNVEVKDEDVSVTFGALAKPQSVVLSVLTPDGQDVTAQTQVTWTDAQDNYVAQGVSLTGLPTGYQTTYRIVLSQELAMAYNTPQPVDYALTDGDNSITCRLNAIPQLKISGKVKDASTGLPLSGAVISASQTFGGKYSKTLNAKTDANGMYTLDIANVPTSVAFAASDYVSQTVNCDSLLTGTGEVTLPDVSLKTITGATIALGFTYTPCDGETQNWYSDYQNVSYELFNVTKNKAISQYNVQYPQIVLLEEVADGDVLRLTATSRTKAFMPVAATATIAEQKAEATFAVVELGKIQSSFTSTGNAAVVGSLYDAAGKLLKTYNYSEASLTISDLADGNYTLVSMGSSRMFNTIYDLAQLPQTGLTEGSDYVLNAVEVKSGAISQINIDEVPTLDESKLYYTGDNTSFTVNKPSIVAGNYLTLTGRIDFKPAYAASVGNVQMIVDLPESCEFVENSVMVGNSTSSYTLNGNRITIPMTRYTDRIRFCIIPTLGGEYAPSAFVQFDLDGETITQPIGSANYFAKDLSISVPSTVAKTSVPISGTAIGASNVEIYDNGVLIGQTTSLANGTWATTCELNNPYNLSRHLIYAKVTTKQGVELQSEVIGCLYDMNAIEVKTVTMINTAHTASNLNLHDYLTVFDFQNPSNEKNTYWYWPQYPTFTYIVDLTNNSQDVVNDVNLKVVKSDGSKEILKTYYDDVKDCWIATQNFTSSGLPINVEVAYNAVKNISIEGMKSALAGELLSERNRRLPTPDTLQLSERCIKVAYSSDRGTYYLTSSYEQVESVDNVSDYKPLTIEGKDYLYTNFNETGSYDVLVSRELIEAMEYGYDLVAKQIDVTKDLMDNCKFLKFSLTWSDNKSAPTLDAGDLLSGTKDFLDNAKETEEKIDDQRQRVEKLKKRIHRLRQYDCAPDEALDTYEKGLDKTLSIYGGVNRVGTLAEAPSSFKSNILTEWISLASKYIKFGSEAGKWMSTESVNRSLTQFEQYCGLPPIEDDNEYKTSNNSNASYVIDPSGYVYESVPSNRLEGVTATVYYKEMVEDMYGDLHENIVKWDASEYAQENPLFTDENGMYAWDVPQGLWQVKFEKEGYETTYSEWLPVPPPQLDVNIAMKQSRQPEIKAARAYEDAVEVEFDKYMMPKLLNVENIMVTADGKVVEGTIELLDEEAGYEGEKETFASKVRFNAAQPFETEEVTVMVSNCVKSYAGTRMQDDYKQTFAIEMEVRKVECDSVIMVPYGKNSTLTVSVLPAAASAGKTLTVKTSSPMILGVETEQIAIDNDGKAEITVSGELPGTAALTFSVEGTDKTAITIANVEQIVYKTVSTPIASVASGSTVEKGAQIELSCKTKEATIYYTLDGSCPCDEMGNRMVYDGTPIIIDESVTIKVMATAPDMVDSDVAEFTYAVTAPTKIEEVVINDQIQIYPLPVRDKLNVTAGGKTIKGVTVSSMNGAVVASIKKVAKTVALDVSTIPTDVYIVTITTKDGVYRRTILKIE